MWKVDIYLEADSKAQKNTERKCAYILETICAGAIKTAEGFQCISGTYHSATLQNLVAALSRIRKTSNKEESMEYVQLSMDEYIQSKNDIKNNLGGIVKSFVRIGWQLTRIDRSGAYKNDGYSSIAEFAAAEYGMTRTGVSRFMNVYETYSTDGDTPELKEQYREFKFSQLTELLQVQEADRQMFTPEVKREDIREFQRFEKENEADPARLLDWKDAKSPEEKLKATIQEFCRENKDILNAVYSSIMEPKDLAEMISPSGSRSYRKGTVYLMFYEETKGIMVKVFGETPVDITYRYFLDVVHSLFDEYDAGAHTWEKCFGVLPDEGTTAQKQEEPVEPKMPEHSGKNIGNVHGDISAEKVMEKPEIAPAQQEEQIPGQDSIDQHPEYMPEPVQEPDIPKKPEDSVPGIHKEEQKSDPVPENNETIPEAIPEKAITRKEYLETLTLYGWADYVAAAMRTFGSIPFSRLREISFWEEWLRGKVDKKGRPWIE